jgi:hypothetical protein
MDIWEGEKGGKADARCGHGCTDCSLGQGEFPVGLPEDPRRAVEAQGTKVIRTPVRAPKANAFAERWVLTARRECLDWMLIWGRRHLESVLRTYIRHYNEARPHRGLHLGIPEPLPTSCELPEPLRLRRRDILGGLIHEYERAA